MLRLFIAVNLSAPVVDKIATVSRGKFDANIVWTRPENLHLTVKFLGPTEKEKLPRIIEVLEAVREAGIYFPFQLTAKGAGVFPSENSPKVLWIGIHEPEGKLAATAAGLDERLAALGVARETREYSPHLTVGRVKRGNPGRRFLAAYSKVDFGTSLVSELVLYASETLPAGARYTPLFVLKTP